MTDRDQYTIRPAKQDDGAKLIARKQDNRGVNHESIGTY
jgi:hypothetical protein